MYYTHLLLEINIVNIVLQSSWGDTLSQLGSTWKWMTCSSAPFLDCGYSSLSVKEMLIKDLDPFKVTLIVKSYASKVYRGKGEEAENTGLLPPIMAIKSATNSIIICSSFNASDCFIPNLTTLNVPEILCSQEWDGRRLSLHLITDHQNLPTQFFCPSNSFFLFVFDSLFVFYLFVFFPPAS